MLLGSLLASAKFGVGRGALAVFFVTADLSLLGYASGAQAGTVLYQSAHSYLGPLLLASSWCSPYKLTTTVAIIWIVHIGFDRALDYGLKYASGFAVPHLGLIGRTRLDAAQP
jgi:hypothetical protein